MLELSLLCGLLGAYSGSAGTSKIWRRFIIPLLIFIGLYLKYYEFLWLVFLLILPLSLGYGQPSGLPNPDAGCKISIFLNKWIKSEKWLEVATWSVVSLCFSLCLIPLAILTGNWGIFIAGMISIFACNIFTGGNAFLQNEGSFVFMKRNLLWEEFGRYFVIALVFTSI